MGSATEQQTGRARSHVALADHVQTARCWITKAEIAPGAAPTRPAVTTTPLDLTSSNRSSVQEGDNAEDAGAMREGKRSSVLRRLLLLPQRLLVRRQPALRTYPVHLAHHVGDHAAVDRHRPVLDEE